MARIRSSEKLSRIVRWAIILFFAYALWYSVKGPSTHIVSSPYGAAVQAAKAKDCNETGQHFPAFSMPLLPVISPASSVRDVREGAGVPAQCGQTAKLRYEYATRSGQVIFSSMHSKAAAESLRIGSGALLPGVEQGLVGMKPGGERNMTLPSILAFERKDVASLRNSAQFALPAGTDIKKEVIEAKVALLALSPPMPSSPMPLRMIDTRFGYGTRALCGNTVTVNMTIWKMDGTPLFSTLTPVIPLTFTLGASQVPLGIEEGVMDMMEGSERTLIIPPAYLKRLDPSAPELEGLKKISLPSDAMVLVDINRLPDVEKPAPSPHKK